MGNGDLMTAKAPDRDYLDTFLQGARFALFAVEARLRERDLADEDEIEATLDEFHDLFRNVRGGMDRETPLVTLTSDHLGKN